MPQNLDPNAAYHIALGDEERTMMEQSAFNFHQLTGGPLRIPPRLYDDLKRMGVLMTHMLADPALDDAPSPFN